MQQNKLLRAVIILMLIAVNIGCDQVSKSIIRHEVAPYSDINYLNGHFTITRVENTGAFLSLGDQLHGPLRTILLAVLPGLLLVLGIRYLILNTAMANITLIGICFIIGGGIGNIFDRVVHGSVTDFLYINYPPFHTGVFNLADISISAGALIIIIGMNIKNPPGFLNRHYPDHGPENV